MIQAKATQYPNFISMEIIRPDSSHHEFKRVETVQQGQQIINELTRSYIIAKITGWLRQRKKGMLISDQQDRALIAAKLEVLIHSKNALSLPELCALIGEHSDHFRQLKPGKNAGHYSYYLETIEPIIQFCTGETEVQDA